jgi:hypothetical protein
MMLNCQNVGVPVVGDLLMFNSLPPSMEIGKCPLSWPTQGHGLLQFQLLVKGRCWEHDPCQPEELGGNCWPGVFTNYKKVI